MPLNDKEGIERAFILESNLFRKKTVDRMS